MSTTCASCGAAASGKFCNNCGAALGPRECRSCGASLSPRAKFCHRCGSPAPGAPAGSVASPQASAGATRRSPDSTAWAIAGTTIFVALAAIVYLVQRPPAAVVPDMANTGGAPFAGGAGAGGQAPDISQMSPRERFDRLFDRIMTAAENNDSATVVRFTPMGLGAYAQLDSYDADARYHAAMLHLNIGQTAEAAALADTILQNTPGHLLGYMVRAEVAKAESKDADLKRAYADFLAHYGTEMAAGRQEYKDHGPVIAEFIRQARGETGSGKGN